MAGTYPASPAPAEVSVRSISPTIVSAGHSLARQARSLGGQRWAFRLRYPPLRHSAFAPLWAFLVAQRGQFERFQFALPSKLWPLRGAGGGTPRVSDLAGSPAPNQIGDRTIYTDGWPASATVLKAGDFVKFAGHAKVYIATEDTSSDGAGVATIALEPALIADPADDELVNVGGVTFQVALASDSPEFSSRPMAGGAGGKFSVEIDLIEVYP